jgi:crotonobetaine/carnitine-CoA ligase
MERSALQRNLRMAEIGRDLAKTLYSFVREEAARGTLITNLKSLVNSKDILADMSWAELLEERAMQMPDKYFLLYNDERITYRKMDQNANCVANLLQLYGGGRSKGIGIFMRNSPRYLDVFFGAQKIGMYVVPLNPELKGDGLRYLIDHSDVEFLIVDHELLDTFKAVKADLPKLKHVLINDAEPDTRDMDVPRGMERLSEAYGLSCADPGIGYNPEDMCVIMYTSGTTGRAKGVVYRYERSNVKKLSLVAGLGVRPDDVYYTAMQLCHANALFLTITVALAGRATVALAHKFSAGRFWEDIRRHKVTIFNAIGSMVPILMKQPASPLDSQNNVRYVMSAACPTDMWEPFEERFGLTIYEGYGAVDGGGKIIMNIGTAPVGSIGKPNKRLGEYRLIDSQGNDVPVGTPGELVFKVGKKPKNSGAPTKKKSALEYYKNEAATNDKVKGEWLHTGDLLRADEKGYLYFVGRNTESMRKGGENVSAYEVELVIMDHPAVEEVAVYAVPSELAEDEIMASVKLVEGMTLDPKDLIDFLKDKLAKFAIPRYIRIVKEFPMTSSFRIVKKELEKIGVTPDTFDSKKAG